MGRFPTDPDKHPGMVLVGFVKYEPDGWFGPDIEIDIYDLHNIDEGQPYIELWVKAEQLQELMTDGAQFVAEQAEELAS